MNEQCCYYSCLGTRIDGAPINESFNLTSISSSFRLFSLITASNDLFLLSSRLCFPTSDPCSNLYRLIRANKRYWCVHWQLHSDLTHGWEKQPRRTRSFFKGETFLTHATALTLSACKDVSYCSILRPAWFTELCSLCQPKKLFF